MKRIILFVLAAIAPSILLAEPPKEKQPGIAEWISEALYSSTNTSASVGTGWFGNVSTAPTFLHSVTINTPAASGSKLEIWNVRFGTSGLNADGTALQKIATIDTTSKVTLLYDVYCSTGLYLANHGGADVTASYRER